MRFQNKQKSVNLEERVFKTDGDEFGSVCGWFWLFWLFFIDNPAEVEEPRQLAILWSRKDEKSITCNDRRFEFEENNKGSPAGVVASWYFDGERMNHNFLLKKTDLKMNSSSLKTQGKTPTSFHIEDETCEVRIGDNFYFTAKPRQGYNFAINSISSGEYLLGMCYSMLKSSRLDLESEIKGKVSEGSAYFQRVFVDAPVPSWYWGIFHFENGGFLDYYKPWLLGKSLKEEIAFYDGNETHEFNEASVDMEEKRELPSFHISAETKDRSKEIRFTVKPYSKASWKFEKKIAKIIPNKLTYKEYPAKISKLKLLDRKENRKVTLDDLGSSVGNAEYTTGFLL